jgi:glycosyl transferase family 87
LNPIVAERFADRLRGFARPWELATFVWIPAIILAYTGWYELHARRALEDFGIFRTAAKAVLRGHSPFVAPDPHALAHFDKFVYPPSTAFFFAPFAVLPLHLGQFLMFLAGLLATFAAMRLLGVVDWRCYGLAIMTPPVVNSLALGAVTPFLLLGAALVWRYRDRPAACGATAAVTAVTKLFLWPLGLWLVATRRLRAAAACAVAGALVVVGGWAAIGFAGLHDYPDLLRVLTRVEQGVSYSPIALLGLTGTAATAAALVLTGLVAVAVAVAARGEDGERRAFVVAVAGALVSTPLLWLHYLQLLLIPLALYRPRLSRLWYVQLALWLTPASHANGHSWKIALALAVLGLIVARTLYPRQTQFLADAPSRLRALLPRRAPRPVGAD